jgi:hypothetical protein
MKRRTLFAVALSGILLRASEVLGIEETKPSVPEPKAYTGEWKWRCIRDMQEDPIMEYFGIRFKCR